MAINRTSREILLEAMILQDLINNLDDQAVELVYRKLRSRPAMSHVTERELRREAADTVLRAAGITQTQLNIAITLMRQSNSGRSTSNQPMKSFKDLTPPMTLREAILIVVNNRVPGVSAFDAIRLAQPANTGSTTGRMNALSRLAAAPCGTLKGAWEGHQSGANCQFSYKHTAMNPYRYAQLAKAQLAAKLAA